MENASKALLMATSILIGVLLLSFMAYMFFFMSNYSETVQENLYAKEIYEFNTQFQIYDGRSDLTIQDVKSIVNLVNNYNSKFDDEENSIQAIKMNILGENSKVAIENEITDILKKYQANTYKCDIEYDSDGKVSTVTVKEGK